MKKIILNTLFSYILLFLCISTVLAKEYGGEITNFKIVEVRDGDTFIIDIPNIPAVFGSEIAVRIRGIDTPELKDEREEIREISIQAKEELEKLLLNSNAESGQKPNITLYNLGRDKYFRLLASVKVDNIDIAEYMINKGLAKKYRGGAKDGWN